MVKKKSMQALFWQLSHYLVLDLVLELNTIYNNLSNIESSNITSILEEFYDNIGII